MRVFFYEGERGAVVNLVRFLNFNQKILARFGIFDPKRLIILKYVFFTLQDAIKVNKHVRPLFKVSGIRQFC